jgi:hypothetical protein
VPAQPKTEQHPGQPIELFGRHCKTAIETRDGMGTKGRKNVKKPKKQKPEKQKKQEEKKK